MKSVYLFLNKNIGLTTFVHLLSFKDKYDITIKAIFISENSKFLKKYISLSNTYNIPLYTNLNFLSELELVDFIFSVQYDKILKKEHLEKAKITAVNLHMAPLPKYRGCNQFSFAIINKEKEFGTTLHIMTEQVDSGDIIAQIKFNIPESCTAQELFELTEFYSVKLFEENIEKILNNQFSKIPQDRFVNIKPTHYYRKQINEIKKINPDWGKEKMINHILATTFKGFEPPYIEINNKKYYIIPEDNLKSF